MRLSSRQKGIIFLMLSSFFFAVMALFVKLAGDLPVMQKAFFRNSVAAVVATILLLRTKSGFKFDKKNLPFFFLRAIFGTTAIIANYYAIQNLTLADATILIKLAPFFTIIFSFIFLKEKIRPYQIIAILIAFAASVLIIKPGFSTSDTKHVLTALAGAAGGMLAGAAYTCVRHLSLKKENSKFIVFFFSMFASIVLLPFATVYYQPMSLPQLFFLLSAGVAGALAQFSLTTAYGYAPSRSISVFDYSQIVFSTILGLIAFSEFPDALSLTGIAIIFSVALFMFLHNEKKQN
ncbi:MAG: EamA family transporter [Treponema sp.]|nr:MAG: EamA family transporter [Treponema sp.]